MPRTKPGNRVEVQFAFKFGPQTGLGRVKVPVSGEALSGSDCSVIGYEVGKAVARELRRLVPKGE